VEGQLTPCTDNEDCEATIYPYCNIPEGETEGVCGDCVISAFPGEPGSCDDGSLPGEVKELCGRSIEQGQAGLTLCEACGDIEMSDCQISADFRQEADVVANCQRGCFDYFACTSNADCPTTELSRAFCDVPVGETEGVCGECVVGAFPGESGSCPLFRLEGEDDAGRQICSRSPPDFSNTTCVPCDADSIDEEFDIEIGTDPTAVVCELLATDLNQTADVVANCQRECFAVYACATNADCPNNLPFCNAGQCAVSAPTPTFSPTDGMGGGSSA